MAITLAQAKVGMRDHVSQQFTDELRRNSILLDMLSFDNAVQAGGSGSTLTYGYVKLKTPATAAARAIGGEYTANEAVKEEKTATLKILGGKFSIDRVLAQSGGSAFTDEVAFQLEQKSKATANYFHYLFINGNATSSATQFDGLARLATSNTATADVTATTGAMTAADAEILCEGMDTAISQCMRKPDIILANTKTLNRLKAAARMLAYKTESEDAFGKKVDGYDGIPFADLGKYYTNSTSEGVTTTSGAEIIADNIVYFVCLGMDGVHAVSPTSNDAFIATYLPDYSTAGAVKDGEVEMVTAIVCKNEYAVCKMTIQ